MSTPTPPITPAEPAPLRHVSRHLQQTISLHLRDALGALGWTSSPALFGASPFAVQFGRKSEADMEAIKPNLVAITFGEEPAEEEQELGGGLMMLSTAVVCDIVPANEALGLAVASDLRDVLTGRAAGYRRFLTLRDYTSDPAGVEVPGYEIEFDDVQRRRNDNVDFRLYWQQVIALVELHLPGWE